MSQYALRAETQGTVVWIGISPGDVVAVAGRVASIDVKVGDFVNEGDLLLTIVNAAGVLA